MTLVLRWFVSGTPQPKGSLDYKGKNRRTGGAVLAPGNAPKLNAWVREIRTQIRQLPKPITGPVEVDIQFFLRRPKSHYRSNGELHAGAPRFPIVKPDNDKLERAVWDALTGMVYVDDAQVIGGTHLKRYASTPKMVGAHITVRVIE